MITIIQQFQHELTREERALFEARARRRGRRPGEHLKAVLFAASGVSATGTAGLAERARGSRMAGRQGDGRRLDRT